MADLLTEFSNIPPAFLCDFLSPEEEDALFLNDLEEEFVICFLSYWYSFSVQIRKIGDYFELMVLCDPCDGFRSHFQMTSTAFAPLSNLLAPSEHIHLVGGPLEKEDR